MRTRHVFTWLSCILLVTVWLFADLVEIKYGKYGLWKGELGQFVQIIFEQKSGSKRIETEVKGELVRVTDDFVYLKDEQGIFIDDITRVDLIAPAKPTPEPPVPQKDDLCPCCGHPLKDNSPTSNPLDTGADKESADEEQEGEDKCWAIPLEGKIGWFFGEDDFVSHDWFNFQLVEGLLSAANKARVENEKYIVFEINSDGGDVANRNFICDLVKKYRPKIRFVSYPHKAMNEASTIALTCDEIVAAPDSQIGKDTNNITQVETYYRNVGNVLVNIDEEHISKPWVQLVTKAFSDNSVLDATQLRETKLSSQLCSQISFLKLGNSKITFWDIKIDKKKKAILKQAWDFLEDLVACEKALVKIFGPMSSSVVTGLMKELMDAIAADNGTADARALITAIADRLREQIEHSARVPTQALEKLEKTKFDKPTYDWQFSQDVFVYMGRLKTFKKEVFRSSQERIIEWPDHRRSAGRVNNIVKALKADILRMWSPVDWTTKNKKP